MKILENVSEQATPEVQWGVQLQSDRGVLLVLGSAMRQSALRGGRDCEMRYQCGALVDLPVPPVA